ncbi:MAG: M23 family metallopeptidase [Siphonobacter aquaeclarae]|nr:M23 family metallopeptidase [Siphonobacter aquaeclarae]
MAIRFLLLFFCSFQAVAQAFLFPIEPGKSAQLAGTFAELRPNHFHAGIDIKTRQQEGLSVQSIERGYVSKVLVSRMGYGNVVFVKHPGGETSVYAHLQRFNDKIAAYVRKHQLAADAFEVSLTPGANELPLTRGEEIGLSGNSGSSMGPHLHFEIRDAKGRNLDPLAYSFGEVSDHIPPTFEALAVRTLGSTSRISGRFGRMEFSLAREASDNPSVRNYRLGDTLRAAGEIGLELLGFDMADGSSSRNGLSCVEILVNGREHHYHHMGMVEEAFTDDINIHTDYATYYENGKFFQRCYVADGNDRLSVYSPGNGRLRVVPDSVYQVTLRAWDHFQNKSELTFWVKGDAHLRPSAADGSLRWSIEENWLTIKGSPEDTLTIFQKGASKVVAAAYAGCFLVDLRQGLPDSVQVGEKLLRFGFAGTAYPGRTGRLAAGKTEVSFDAGSLYDTLFVQVAETNGKITVSEATIPLKGRISISYLPDHQPQSYLQTAAYREGEEPEYLGGTWEKGRIRFSTPVLGTFYLATDSIAPKITPERVDSLQLRFRVRDNLSGIRSWKARIGQERVILSYDAKNDLLFSEERTKDRPFRGELMLEVTDNSGNKANFGRPKVTSR